VSSPKANVEGGFIAYFQQLNCQPDFVEGELHNKKASLQITPASIPLFAETNFLFESFIVYYFLEHEQLNL
jgi:hypothetical protein